MDLYFTLLKGTGYTQSPFLFDVPTKAIGTTVPKLCYTAPSDVQSFNQDLDQ